MATYRITCRKYTNGHDTYLVHGCEGGKDTLTALAQHLLEDWDGFSVTPIEEPAGAPSTGPRMLAVGRMTPRKA